MQQEAEGFFASKMQPPPARVGLVPRPDLVVRLANAQDVPIATVVAPAGYGKTTLLAEWAHSPDARVAWLSIDEHDNDLATFVTYIAGALNRVEAVDPSLLQPPPPGRSMAANATRLAAAMSNMEQPAVLVLDHVELLRSEECIDTLAELALHLPERSRLVLASRREPPLPMPRIRARGDLIEIGVDDLAMKPGEARALLERAGVTLDEKETQLLVERSEGWPVGLYLAALAMKAGGSRDVGVPFSGDDKLVADYLRSEVLAYLSNDEVQFLTRTSILERMNGALCDAVVERSDSRRLLDELARSNLLLIALDRRGDWYRYHHLFRDLLRAELERREPDQVPALHLHAARWYATEGLPDLAIDHAQAAGDAEFANELMLVHSVRIYNSGRQSAALEWMRWFDEQHVLGRFPGLALLGAIGFGTAGLAVEAEYCADVGLQSIDDERFVATRRMPDGSTLAGWRSVVRTMLARDSYAAVRADAHAALQALDAHSGFCAVAYLVLGACDRLDGASTGADDSFRVAVDFAIRNTRMLTLLVSVSERGLIAFEAGADEDADSFSRQALEIMRSGIADFPESVPCHALAARLACRRRSRDDALTHMAAAARVRPQLTHARPVLSVLYLTEMARAYADLEDVAGAREVLRQAREVLQRRPGLSDLSPALDRVADSLDRVRSVNVGASALTAAELRLVPYLRTHLTFPQIGERLFVSRNTVKSQAISVYQKLGVSSRAEAVQRLDELGLLDH